MKTIIVFINVLNPFLMSFSSSKQVLGKPFLGRKIINTSLLAGAEFFTGINQVVQAETKSIVAVEPLVCDLVSAIALPSSPVTCLIDRKQDVHDLKISPRQAQALNNASQVLLLGKR